MAILFGALALTFALWVVSAVFYYSMGELWLREFRRQYPVQWEGAGQPSFLSASIAGRGYWRPIRAENFFRYREYATLPDVSLIQRAEKVKRWQTMMWSLLAGWLCLAGLIAFLVR